MDDRQAERDLMVDRQLVTRGIADESVLDAMRRVPRHEFLPQSVARSAYRDSPVPIGEQQTMSQPYIVALMCEAMALGPTDRALDIGTGSGYAAAIMSCLCAEVYTIERHQSLADEAQANLARLGYSNVTVRSGDGTKGWPEQSPFDAIAVAAAAERIPEALIDQLTDGGRLVVPFGPHGVGQELLRITRHGDGIREESLCPVRFVPLIE